MSKLHDEVSSLYAAVGIIQPFKTNLFVAKHACPFLGMLDEKEGNCAIVMNVMELKVT